MRLAICTAWPAAPFPRLSVVATTTARPACGSAVTWTCAPFDPATAPVTGHWPAGSRCTNGSPAYASANAPRSALSGSGLSAAAGVSRAVQVARMPRGIGASTGVKEIVTGGESPRARSG